MVRTVKLGFNEPFTGIWVEGKDEFHFKNEQELKKVLLEWERYLSRLYGANIELVVITWSEQ